jgi:hypothetical protein
MYKFVTLYKPHLTGHFYVLFAPLHIVREYVKVPAFIPFADFLVKV